MRATNMTMEISVTRRLASMAALTVVILLLLGYAHRSFAQKSGPRTFASGAEACHALHQAVANHDEQELEAILGVGREATSPGDAAEDKAERDDFIQKYQQMHRLVKEPDGTMVLYVGAENWPFPVPLVSMNGRWLFDAEAGKEEILFRRIGENEETAIDICRALVASHRMPNGERISQSVTSGLPFHGYYFHPVGQIAKATTTAQPVLAFVAYPAKYRSSGVFTFIVTQQGAVYERDLGPKTETVARNIKRQSSLGWKLVN